MNKEALKLALEWFEKDGEPDHHPVVTAIKEALAQPEPVAWEQFYPDIGKPQLTYPPQGIYYTPPQRTWVGLTDEEVNDLYNEGMGINATIEATEAKLKDKNNG